MLLLLLRRCACPAGRPRGPRLQKVPLCVEHSLRQERLEGSQRRQCRPGKSVRSGQAEEQVQEHRQAQKPSAEPTDRQGSRCWPCPGLANPGCRWVQPCSGSRSSSILMGKAPGAGPEAGPGHPVLPRGYSPSSLPSGVLDAETSSDTRWQTHSYNIS